MTKRVRVVSSDLVCLECGHIFTIQRRTNDLKKVGHIKHLYCSNCMCIQAHYEVREIIPFVLNCYSNGISNLDAKTKIIFNYLVERVDDDFGRENKVYKKIFTKR